MIYLYSDCNIVKKQFLMKYGVSPVLDIGCGNHPYWINSLDIIGLDLCNINADVIGDAHILPFRDNVFNTILLFDILEHSTYYGLILDEAIRVARDNAIFLISVPYGDGYSAEHDNSHMHTYTIKTVSQAIRSHGLNIIEVYRYCKLRDNIIIVAENKY